MPHTSPDAAPSRTDQKLQRWIDILAALLNRTYGATRAQLREEVPGYADAPSDDALERMFERDKDELRALGIPITVHRGDDGEPDKYGIDRREMYLPYLALTRGAPRPEKPGYRSLSSLVLEPDELSAVVAGARLARALGDPDLTADVESAIRKVTFDLGHPDWDPGAAGAARPLLHEQTGAALRLLGEALLRRKRVTFTYRSMTSDATAEREVEPYGLFFTSGHWYLAARDVAKDELRNFRVSRLTDVTVNAKRAQSTDYDIPAGFRLAEHARSREAWELGDDDAEEMVVAFRVASGATHAAAQLGQQVEGHDDRRRFQVRRLDAFARWLLSFGGDVVPLSPPRLVDAVRDLARATRDVYASPGRP